MTKNKFYILISVIIIFLVFFLGIRSLNFLVKDISYKAYENDCKTIYHQTSNRNIVLRVDDIQAHAWKDIQIRMINDALDKNKTLVLGVIPFNLLGDNEIVRFLKENRCKLEISLHGYNNTDYEFASLSYIKSEEKIKKGLKVLNEIEPRIITFIPPNNEYSNESEKAIYSSGFNVISGEGGSKYDYTQSPYDWHTGEFINYEEILVDCNKLLDKKETCVIMTHPQDYADNYGKLDLKKYQNYLNLLDGIDDLNANVITFKDLYYKDEEIIKLG